MTQNRRGLKPTAHPLPSTDPAWRAAQETRNPPLPLEEQLPRLSGRASVEFGADHLHGDDEGLHRIGAGAVEAAGAGGPMDLVGAEPASRLEARGGEGDLDGVVLALLAQG